jgi:hypothetical protein
MAHLQNLIRLSTQLITVGASKSSDDAEFLDSSFCHRPNISFACSQAIIRP